MRATIFVLLLGCFSTDSRAESPSAAGQAAAPTLLELSLKTRAARLAGDTRTWLEYGKQVLARAPDHPDLLISVARAQAANGHVDAALPLLRDAVDRGAGFDLFALPEFAALKTNDAWRALADRAAGNVRPVSRADVFVEFKNAGMRPEGITHDPKSRRWFVGSLAGEIWQVDEQAQAKPFIAAGRGLREVLGLKVDVERRLLWAVSGVFPDTLPTGQAPKADLGVTSLQAFHLDTAERVRNCELDERPTLHGFNDLALARNGDVYATDTTANSVYRLRPSGCEFEVLIRDAAMSSPNGIVLAHEDARLYVAHIEGISSIDTRTGARRQLVVGPRDAVNSIDGLALADGDLLGIQGSPYLARVARIRLSSDGLAVREVSALSARTGEGLNQTTGVVAGKYFYAIAGLPNALAPNAAAGPEKFPQILRMPLRM